jgi:hypothetical protein
MKILMLFHDFDVIDLLFHDFDVLWSVIPWFWRHNSVNHVISVTKHIYHGSYSWTYLNKLIRKIHGKYNTKFFFNYCLRSADV